MSFPCPSVAHHSKTEMFLRFCRINARTITGGLTHIIHRPSLESFCTETSEKSTFPARFAKVGLACRARLSPPGELFSRMKWMPERLFSKGQAWLVSHVHQRSGGDLSGRWSRRGREVPLGKRHLQRAQKNSAARSPQSSQLSLPRCCIGCFRLPLTRVWLGVLGRQGNIGRACDASNNCSQKPFGQGLSGPSYRGIPVTKAVFSRGFVAETQLLRIAIPF